MAMNYQAFINCLMVAFNLNQSQVNLQCGIIVKSKTSGVLNLWNGMQKGLALEQSIYDWNDGIFGPVRLVYDDRRSVVNTVDTAVIPAGIAGIQNTGR